MDVKDFYYDLPQELIAQDPLEDRSSSRLMVLDKITGEVELSLIHISEPTRRTPISYAVFCLKKKKKRKKKKKKNININETYKNKKT